MDLSDEAVYLVDVRSTFGDSCISPDLELVEIANPSKPRKNTGNVQYILFQSLSSKPQEKKTKQRTWPDEPEDGGHRPSPPSLGGSGRKSGAAGSKTTDGTSMQNKQVAIYLSIYIYTCPHSPLIPTHPLSKKTNFFSPSPSAKHIQIRSAPLHAAEPPFLRLLREPGLLRLTARADRSWTVVPGRTDGALGAIGPTCGAQRMERHPTATDGATDRMTWVFSSSWSKDIRFAQI